MTLPDRPADPAETLEKPRKPEWLRVRLPTGEAHDRFVKLKETMRRLDLHTVCEEAKCPNIFECWGQGTATIMILGETCTRGCRFCSVATGNPEGFTDPREPENVGRMLGELDLAYVVLTMVDRDDLLDGGAAHVAQTIRRIKHYSPQLLVETLLGDFQGVRKDVEHVVREGRPDVFAHNVEVVPRLQRTVRDARCSWERSVEVLRWAKAAGAQITKSAADPADLITKSAADPADLITKSSIMVGLGETEDEVYDAMERLRAAEVDVVTFGQYLQPTKKHAEVKRFVEPAEFDRYREAGEAMGFRFVASGPLVRSSYRAAEAFLHGVLTGQSEAEHADRYGKKKKHLAVVT